MRLLRISHAYKWEDSTRKLIYDKLRELTQAAKPPFAAPTGASTPPAETSALPAAASSPPAPSSDATQAPRSFSLSLKNMIEQGAQWHAILKLLDGWWQAQPSPALACKIVELSYIWSGPTGAEETLQWFQDLSFWQQLHKAIRKHILLHAYKNKSTLHVRAYLRSEAFAPWLTAVERLMVFTYSATQKDYAFLLRFHNKYARELSSCLESLGPSFALTPGQLKYTAALARMDQGHGAEALTLLQTILPSDPLYGAASKLKRTIATQKKSPTHVHLHSKIVGEVVMKSQWEEREATLRHYLEKIRISPENSQGIAAVMNDLLTQKNIIPMERAGMLSRCVGMCLEYFDLYPYVPNILLVLSQNACRFHSPSVDGAIWNHFLGGDIPDFPCTPWKAVALFHRFMMMGPEIEEALWQSYELMHTPWEGSEYVMDIDFAALKKAAYTWLSEGPLHDAPTAQVMKACLALCTDDRKLAAAHIEDYLRLIAHPPLGTLLRLLSAAQSKKDPALLHRITHALIQNGYLRTQDLRNYLNYTIQKGQHDLSWRLITVLKGRCFSLPALEAIWQVSGENRQRYHLLPTTLETVETYLGAGQPPSSQKVFCALLRCGYRIPDLIALASYRHHTKRWKTPTADSLEESILQGLEEYSWLNKPPKRISESVSHPFSALGIPESTTWMVSSYSVCASYLFEFLGLLCVAGDLFRLSPLASLTTNPEAGGWQNNPTKKACYKWFRSLSDEERLAWLDITTVIQKKPSAHLSKNVAQMVFRLTLMLLPAHKEALTTLRQLRMPLPYLRDLETFILSEAYSKYRQDVRLTIKVPVPAYPSLPPARTLT